jgi:rhodanese-related sulfurtransferase
MKRTCHSYLLFAAIALLLSSCATAPASRPIRNVTAEQLQGLLDQHALTLVDTRTEYEFRKGHIPGAVLISPDKFDDLARLLPRDKGVHLVFYCRGSG